MDDHDGAEPLRDEDFLAVEPSPDHEVVYQAPRPPPAPDARTIETEKVKIAPDPERAALAKQTTVKILSRRPPEPQVTPPEVRVAYAKRSRHLFLALMVLLAIAGVWGGAYLRKSFTSSSASPSSPSPSPLPSPTVPPTNTASAIAPPSFPDPTPSAPSKRATGASPSTTRSTATSTSTKAAPPPHASNVPPLGPPVF